MIRLTHQIKTAARRGAVYVLFAVLFLGATGCSSPKENLSFLLPAKKEEMIQSFLQYSFERTSTGSELSPDFFSSDYCVPTQDTVCAELEGFTAKAGFLFNITDQTPVYFSNIEQRIYPASTTKLLTALTMFRLLEESGRGLEEIVTIQQTNGGIEQYGAKLCGFSRGDRVSLSGLLNALLVYSGNDAGIAIAQALCGDADSFVQKMNAVAAEVGATHTHFVNPHGLHNKNHYTTAYDMYLIFRECLRYESFLPIVRQTSYTVDYTDAGGNAKKMLLESTNQFFLNTYDIPEGIILLGGKTGSTSSAGDCFITMSVCDGKEYISAVFGAEDKAALYHQMQSLLKLELSDNTQK